MSSSYNLNSVSRTLAHRIWHGIRDDPHLRSVITNEGQIVHHLPRETQGAPAVISVFLYNISEYTCMRNQPQPTQNQRLPRTLLYLNLRYLIVPMTFNAENDQIVLGRIMQLFSEKPVLREDDLKGSLRESGDELRIALENVSVDDLGKLWSTLQSPYRLCVGYSVYPVRIQASPEPKELPSLAESVVSAKNKRPLQ